MITRAHILAWTLAALSGGVLACETAPEEKSAPAKAFTPAIVYTPGFGESVEYFRHGSNDCYVYRPGNGISCVRHP